MLEAERALARAEARVGVITQEDANAVAAACDPERYDIEVLLLEARQSGNPAEPLARRLREVAPSAHHGATSQDIMDTAAVLVGRTARGHIVENLELVAAACAKLADEHRATVMAARTLMQQATPTTFGAKAAGWLVGVIEAKARLSAVALPAQLGGAGGTLAALGGKGVDVLGAYAEELALAEPTVPWHANRFPLGDLAAALDLTAAACAKIAVDIQLLAQTEVAEVREASDGRSSTMPHKRNPIGSTLARACAIGVHAAAGILISGVHEHERAAAAWHAEWRALSDALALTGGAVDWLRVAVVGLQIDPARMRANIRAETLSEAERVGVGATEPEDYLGAANDLVDRALALYGA